MAGLSLGQWNLTVRVDRPVEGCEIAPQVYFYQKGEKGNPAIQPVKHTFTYRWLRGPERPVCANENCPRGQTFSPLQWSKHSRKGFSFSIQCVCCAKLHLPRHKSVFCTPQCFQDAWKGHKKYHASRAMKGNMDGHEEVGGELEDDTPPPPPTDYLMADTSDDEWEEVCTERCYCPSGVDIGHCLKLEVKVLGMDGSLLSGPKIAETEPVLSAPPPPPKRGFATVKNAATAAGHKFRVATYNLLAEIYATQQMYPYCDHWALSWNYRKENLLREMAEIGADVLFLQEVQADHYEQHIQPALNEKGYEGIYKNKTREAMGAQGKVDGCAIFWRKNKFRLAEKYFLEYNDWARRQAGELGFTHDQQQQYLQRLLKDNIAMAAILEILQPVRGPRQRHSMLCVANTHLYSHPEFPDVKLWQSHSLMQWLGEIVLPNSLPLIVCGDFNSEPRSAVYELMSQQIVPPDHEDVLQDPADVLRAIIMTENQISHGVQLKSAYYSVMGEEPRYTNFTVGYIGVLDYIWFTPNMLRPLAVAPVPEEGVLANTGEALPSAQYSSDHILLCCDMLFDESRVRGAGAGLGVPGLGQLGAPGPVLGDLRGKPAIGLTPTRATAKHRR